MPNALMVAMWVAADPDIILPSPFLILPPEEGLVRRDARPVPDYRGQAAAFSAEPELADLADRRRPVSSRRTRRSSRPWARQALVAIRR